MFCLQGEMFEQLGPILHPQRGVPVHWTALLNGWVSPRTLLENRFYRQLQFLCPLQIGTTNAEIPSKSWWCRSTSLHILCKVITLCLETKIWMEHFEQFPRCNQANFGKRTCVISVPSCEASPERTHPEASLTLHVAEIPGSTNASTFCLCPESETKIWIEHFEQFPWCNQAKFGP